MFNKTHDRVVLIRKKRPAWQAGRFNGVGGHVDRLETPIQAMVREFREEVGVDTKVTDWRWFADMHRDDGESPFRVWVYWADGSLEKVKTAGDEEVRVFSVDFLPRVRLGNVGWLIKMALDMGDSERNLEPYKVQAIIGAK
jgi:8-oxo-dGTP diphosphatase